MRGLRMRSGRPSGSGGWGKGVRDTQLALLAVAAACVLAGGAAFAVPEGEGRSAADPRGMVSNLPLSSALPTRSFAVLNEGVVKGRQWGAYAFKMGDRTGSPRPCVSVVGGVPTPGGGFSVVSGNPTCGEVAAGKQPLVSVVSFDKAGAVAFGMAFSSNVSRVYVELSPGPSSGKKTRMLSVAQANKARVHQFRYLAFSVSRNACLVRMTGFTASGAQVFQTPERRCRSS